MGVSCFELVAADPVVLHRSEAEAGRLMAHMPPAGHACLRLLALHLRHTWRQPLAAVSFKMLAPCAAAFQLQGFCLCGLQWFLYVYNPFLYPRHLHNL